MVTKECILFFIAIISGFIAYKEINPTATFIAKIILGISLIVFLSHIPSDSGLP